MKTIEELAEEVLCSYCSFPKDQRHTHTLHSREIRKIIEAALLKQREEFAKLIDNYDHTQNPEGEYFVIYLKERLFQQELRK